MKLFSILTLVGCALFGFTACDNIDEADRFDGPITVTSQKNVLVEDFTGQKCVNCPLAADVIKNLQKEFGKEHVISVALHGGAQSVSEADSPLGLANEESLAYNREWKVAGWPKGLVDRVGGLLDKDKWMESVVSRLGVAPKVDLAVEALSYNAETRELSFNAQVKGLENVSGKLQIWLTESQIITTQLMPNKPELGYHGGINKEYEHNHVFRASVNDHWGDEMTVAETETQSKAYTYTLKEKWNPENMSLVLFFYNDAEGVMQVIDQEIR